MKEAKNVVAGVVWGLYVRFIILPALLFPFARKW